MTEKPYLLAEPHKYYCSGCGQHYATLTHWNEVTGAYKISMSGEPCECDAEKEALHAAALKVAEEWGHKQDLKLLELFIENQCDD